MTEPLLIESHRDGALEIVTLNRPEVLNALDRPLIDALNTYFEGLVERDPVRVVILRGEGRAFCAGLDLKSPSNSLHTGVRAALDVQQRIARIVQRMRRCPQPVIALVQGAACGGGFSLALASDVRIAAPDARMNAAYINIGLSSCDIGCSYLLPRLIGASVAAELMLTARFLTAERAEKLGFTSETVAADKLLDTGLALADEMLAKNPMGLRLTKQGLAMNIDAPSLEAAMALEDRQQVLLTATADHREAIGAFLDKRPPAWRDS
ncbi:enoyl-CoA hydratase/isomerase family protein [Sandaracinobacteroides saxicola]|uniref:Enoyl-CoA hydratase/isomerase family protein n=1 Tax=Sandaracinobacteroides saxicola TaxID=2759707 RepID=A0A7G5II21_9SPHN|nr:enoyl-CoA hydratase/isomerase family protein [Sandaracinobacteroides saxicola]QMW23013.1 enoyl-CoA hydratase/isomerase family protein [Sandaracinobacteroides saxicola]